TITSRTLPAVVVAMAVSNDGKHLYVVTGPTGGATVQQLHVLDTTKPGMPDFNANPIDIPNSAASDVVPAVAPDGRLFAFVVTSGEVLEWGSDLDTSANPAPPALIRNLGANLRDFALSSDGKTAFSLGPNEEIQSPDLASAAVTAVKVLPAGSKPSTLGVVASTGPDLLAVCDQTGSNFYLVALSPSPSLVGTVKLDHPPIDVVVSPGG